MKSIKVSQYFKIIHPKYTIFKLIPDTSIGRNYNSGNIANTIHSLYKDLKGRIRKDKKAWNIEAPLKCSFYIDIRKTSVDFYFIVPDAYQDLFREKVIETWSKVTIQIVEYIPDFSKESLKHHLYYKYEHPLSLNLDKKCNEPLNSILNVINIMKDDDRVGILYNFMPTSQENWVKKYNRTIGKIKNGESVLDEFITPIYLIKVIVTTILEIGQGVLEAFEDLVKEPSKSQDGLLETAISSLLINDRKEISKATQKKKDAIILNTQIIVQSDSTDSERKYNNSLAVLESFKSINDDNELKYRKLKSDVDYKNFKISNANINKMSTEECQNFLELPGRELLQQHKIIQKVDVLETEVPEELQKGVIRVGESIYKGKSTKVYQTEDKELKNTAICLCGPNRSGKSTLIANIVYDVMCNGRSVILPDFCGKCQLSDELAQVIPKEKIINIECNVWDTLQGFGWNEIVPKDDSIFELYNCAKMKAAKLKELINLVNDGESDLEGRMERYLECAALIVFVCGGSVNDVFKVLKNHKSRHEYIEKIPEELKEDMDEYVQELCEIDEWSKATKDNPSEVIGTKQGHISAVLSRVHRLKQNAYIEMMLKRSTDNNINLIEEMQKGKLICIRMYDSMFATQQQKDIYVCYWITKVWGALQKRFCDIDQEKLTQTVILIDELYQTKNCEKYLTSILSQMPKYRTKLVLSCHHLAQIPVIQEELKSAMCSYMFIAGSNKKNFNAMKEEFEDKGYSLEDLLHLKRFHAMCLLAYEEGYWSGIVHMPLPIK